jgi:hypothetical protein
VQHIRQKIAYFSSDENRSAMLFGWLAESAYKEKVQSFLAKTFLAIIFLMFIIERMYPATFPNVFLKVNLTFYQRKVRWLH